MAARPGAQQWKGSARGWLTGAGQWRCAPVIRIAILSGALACSFHPVLAENAGDKAGKNQVGANNIGLRAGSTPGEPVAIATPAAGKAAELPAILAIDIAKSGTRTVITIKSSGIAAPAPFLLADPDRAVIDLPEVRFDLPAGAGFIAGGGKKQGFAVSGYRFGQLEAGKSRIVMDLSGPVKIAATRSEVNTAGSGFVIEFETTSRAAFLAEARRGESPAPAAGQNAPGDAGRGTGDGKGLPVIVLDPGHGGIDTGARGAAQAFEKEVVLAFARTLGEKLEESGRYKVIFTRQDDVFISLPDRVRIARQAGAKLFISIHADTLNERWVEGATVYTAADKASDAHAARLAEKENQSDKLAGVEAGEDTGDVSDILFDLTRKETRAFSHYFARSLVAYWKDAGKLNKNPIRSAGFRVLMAPDVPSVLLELGYLSSKAEAAKLEQPEWRAKAAASVAQSIDAFFLPSSRPVEGLAPATQIVPQMGGQGAQTGVAAAIR